MLISTGWSSWKKRIRQLQQKNLLARLQVGVKFKTKEKNMKKSILVGLVALGLVACGAAPEAEVAADKAAEDSAVAAPLAEAEVPAADAAVVEEAPAAEVVEAAPVAQ
jgi:hypothetical protein